MKGRRYTCTVHGDIGSEVGRYPAKILQFDGIIICRICYAEDLVKRLGKVEYMGEDKDASQGIG